MAALGEFIAELRERKVLKTVALYAFGCWIVLQASDVLSEPLSLSLWFVRALVVAMVLGAPFVVAVGWFFDMTPQGLLLRGGRKPWPLVPSLAFLLALTSGVFIVSGFFASQFDSNQEPFSETVSQNVTGTRIAILPFERQDDSVPTYLTGLSGEIARLLRRTPAFATPSQDAIDAIQPGANTGDLGRRLGVEYLLYGVLRTTGSGVQLSMRVVESESGLGVWTAEYADVLSALEFLTDEVVSALSIEVGDAAELFQPIQSQSISREAYDSYLKALQLDATGDSVGARQVLEQVASSSPRFGLAYAALCELAISRFRQHLDPDDYANAEGNCFRALRLDKESPEVHSALGRLYLVAGQLAEAQKSLAHALELNPNHYQTRIRLAMAAKNAIEKERGFKALIRQDPGNPRAYFALQKLYFDLGRYEEATETMEWVLRLTPNNKDAQSAQSSNLILAGKFDQARELLEGLARDPESRDETVLENLGSVYFFDGEYIAAAKIYQEALGSDELKHPVTYRNLGDALWHAGRIAEANEAYEKLLVRSDEILAINPDDESIWREQVVGYASLGLGSEVRRWLAKHQELEDPQTCYTLAVAFVRLGELDVATEYARLAQTRGFPKALLNSDPDILQTNLMND